MLGGRDAWWGGRHVGWQRLRIEGGSGGRAAHDGAVACDGGEGKGWGGAACKGAVVVACNGAGDPLMWVGSHWGRVGLGWGRVGEGEGRVRARRGSWVGGASSWVCISTSVR